MITFDEFIKKWQGKFLEVGGSPGALNQCVDCANGYLNEVHSLPKILGTNAIDFPSRIGDKFEFIKNSPTNVPSKGDLVIWGKPFGKYTSNGKTLYAGHIGICVSGDANTFTSFDQNFLPQSPCTLVNHVYAGVLGWLHKKPESVITEPSVGKIYTEEEYKTLQGENQINWDKWQAELKARNEDIETLCKMAGCDNTFPALKARIDSWEKEKEKDRQTIGKLEDELKDVSTREAAHVKQIDELQKAIQQQRLDNELKVSSLVDQLDILKAKITQTQEKKNWLDQLLSYFKG